jgi:myo-inositol-1(or 4)-monophosphatase
MLLTTDHLFQLAECAIKAARKAGMYISETRPLHVQRKTGGDTLASQVLTEVDQQSQDIVLQTLEPTFAEFDLALLTEESPDDGSRLIKDYFWCIDPIDGTLPFIEAVPGYCVSIALISREGVPQIGVVYDPVEHTLYHAIKGVGAFRNAEPWSLKEKSGPLSFIVDRSVIEEPLYPKMISGLEKIALELGYGPLQVTSHGGGVMNACWVLETPPGCYFKFPKPREGGGSLWDYAATACIYHELGAVASDIHGNPLDLNRPDSSFMNHRGILFATSQELAGKIMDLFKALKPA